MAAYVRQRAPHHAIASGVDGTFGPATPHHRRRNGARLPPASPLRAGPPGAPHDAACTGGRQALVRLGWWPLLARHRPAALCRLVPRRCASAEHLIFIYTCLPKSANPCQILSLSPPKGPDFYLHTSPWEVDLATFTLDPAGCMACGDACMRSWAEEAFSAHLQVRGAGSCAWRTLLGRRRDALLRAARVWGALRTCAVCGAFVLQARARPQVGLMAPSAVPSARCGEAGGVPPRTLPTNTTPLGPPLDPMWPRA